MCVFYANIELTLYLGYFDCTTFYEMCSSIVGVKQFNCRENIYYVVIECFTSDDQFSNSYPWGHAIHFEHLLGQCNNEVKYSMVIGFEFTLNCY